MIQAIGMTQQHGKTMNRIVIILLLLIGFAAEAQIATNQLRLIPRDTVTNLPTWPAFAPYGFYYNFSTGFITYKDATGFHKLQPGGGGGGGGGGTIVAVNGTANRIDASGTTTRTLNISSTFEALLGKVASPLSQFSATTSAQLRGVLSDETGTGISYFVGGDLGTPSAGIGTNFTGIPLTGLSTFSSAQLRTQLTDEVGTGNIYTVGGALGTPASADLTNATNLPITGLGASTSAQLRAILTDEVGTGNIYTVGGPLSTPSSGVLTNMTGLPITGITSSTSAQLGTLLSDDVGTGPLYFGQPIEATTTTAVSLTLNTGHYSEYSYSGLIRTTNTGPINITVPTNATAAIALKTKIFIDNQGTDTVTVVWAGGVTHNDGGYVEIPPHSTGFLYKVATNEWDLTGTGPGGSGGGGGGTGECLWATSTETVAHTFSTADVAICNNSGIIRYTGSGNVNFTMPAFTSAAFESGTGIVVNNQSTSGTITIVFSGGIGGGGHTYDEIGPGETGTLVNAGTDVWDLLGTKTVGVSSWTSWTPTFTGFTGSVTGTARYKLEDKTLQLHVDVQGTSNAAGTTWTMTLPTGIQSSSTQIIMGQAINNSLGVDGMILFGSSSNTVTMYHTSTGTTNWTSGNVKGIRFNGLIEIN